MNRHPTRPGMTRRTSGEDDSWLKSASPRSANPSPRRPSASGSRSRATPVAVDEPLVELETDKVTIEVPAPAAGVLADIAAKDGETVAVGALLGEIKEGAGAPPQDRAGADRPPDQKTADHRADQRRRRAAEAARKPEAQPPTAATCRCAPSVRKLAAESGMDAATVPGSGKDGRVTKGDMMAAIERAAAQPTPVAQPASAVQVRAPSPPDDAAREERVKMTRLRADHRAPAEGRAEHRRHAHDLQRGRHERT